MVFDEPDGRQNEMSGTFLSFTISTNCVNIVSAETFLVHEVVEETNMQKVQTFTSSVTRTCDTFISKSRSPNYWRTVEILRFPSVYLRT